MAEVTVRIKFNQDFTVICDAEDADEAINDIAERQRLNGEIIDIAYDAMTVVEGNYDEPEPVDEEEEEENEVEEAEEDQPD